MCSRKRLIPFLVIYGIYTVVILGKIPREDCISIPYITMQEYKKNSR